MAFFTSLLGYKIFKSAGLPAIGWYLFQTRPRSDRGGALLAYSRVPPGGGSGFNTGYSQV